MLVATITEAKNRLSALIDQVRGGESVLIVDRGIPVARLESAIGAELQDDGRIARLERAGVVRSARKPPAREILSEHPPTPRPGSSGVRIVLEDRRAGR
jgi:prevent-host-death family protein